MTKAKDESAHPNYDLLCMVQDICGDVRKQRAMLNSLERQLADLLHAMRSKDFDRVTEDNRGVNIS